MAKNVRYELPGGTPVGIGCLFLSLAFMIFCIGVFLAAWRWAF